MLLGEKWIKSSSSAAVGAAENNITAAWAYYRHTQEKWGEGEGRWGGKGGKKKTEGERNCKEGFIDGSHEWGRKGYSDCEIRVVIGESGYQNQAGMERHAVAACIH